MTDSRCETNIIRTLGGRVQQLEEENRLLRESSEKLKGQLAQVVARQRSARLPEEIAVGGSKVNEDLGNVQRDVAKLKEEISLMMRMTRKDFAPSMKKRKKFSVPDGIIAHLTRQCSGNVHDRQVLEVTSGSFEKETQGANAHSGASFSDPSNAAKNAVDLEAGSLFASAYRQRDEKIPHTRNNWLCYDFKERRIVPTHYAIRTNGGDPGWSHLKSWLVETSANGKSWQEVARGENNEQLNGSGFTGTFTVAGDLASRFIRRVNIGKNHYGDDQLRTSGWEIFGAPSNEPIPTTSLSFSARADGAGGPPSTGRSPGNTRVLSHPLRGCPPRRNDGNPRGLDGPLLPQTSAPASFLRCNWQPWHLGADVPKPNAISSGPHTATDSTNLDQLKHHDLHLESHHPTSVRQHRSRRHNGIDAFLLVCTRPRGRSSSFIKAP
jgi:hypothetical protein